MAWQARAIEDGQTEREAVPAELLHHEGERAAAQEGAAAEPREPGPAHRAQAAHRQNGGGGGHQQRQRQVQRECGGGSWQPHADPGPQCGRYRSRGARRPREGGVAQAKEGGRELMRLS